MVENNPYESPQSECTPATADDRDDQAARGAATRAWRSQDFVFSFAQQGVLLALTALMLDGGVLLRMCLTAAIAYWIGVMMMVVRRRTSPTKLDVALVKFGFLFCFLLVFPVAFAVAAVMAFR